LTITPKKTYRNPIMENGADPWMYLHTDGYYYFMATRGDRLDLWRSKSMYGISDGMRKTVWLPPASGPNSSNLWAPEIHHFGSKWYIYFTANDGGGDDTRRIYVLEHENVDPMKEGWVEKGAVNTEFAGLDGTVLEHGGKLYFMYAGYGHFPEYGSAIYAAEMENPWTLRGSNVLLTKPEYEWEHQGGMAINEGPCFLKRFGRVFLIYSASTCWSDDYALGMLSAAQDSDLLDPASWTKSELPVFHKSVDNGVFGPGHNSFTLSPDGTEDWIVYHAIAESGGGSEKRSTRIQKFSWTENGKPDFGVPLSLDTEIPVPYGEVE
jgi:GH43 family beta-xylosidase